MGGPFFKSEMGGLLRAWHLKYNRGRRSVSGACQGLRISEI